MSGSDGVTESYLAELEECREWRPKAEALAEAAGELELAHSRLIDAVTPGKGKQLPEAGSDEYNALFSAWHAASRKVREALARYRGEKP